MLVYYDLVFFEACKSRHVLGSISFSGSACANRCIRCRHAIGGWSTTCGDNCRLVPTRCAFPTPRCGFGRRHKEAAARMDVQTQQQQQHQVVYGWQK